MVLTEAIRGRKGIIQRILNDNLQDDPKGSRFIVQTEGSDKFNMMSVRDIAWINHAEDEKNKTGYYTEAAQEILSKEPLFIAGDVVTIRNDMGPIEYAIKESKRVDNVIDGGIYPVYQYQMVLVNDEYADNFHPDVCMCEEYDLVFQRHDEMLEKYFTEGKISDSAKLEPKFKVGDVVSDYDFKNYIVTEIREFDRGIDKRYEYVVLPFDYHDGNESIVIKESDASFRYHDKTWEEYFTESVGNGLPAWRGGFYNYFELCLELGYETNDLNRRACREYNEDTIPPACMQHILKDHSIHSRIDTVVNSNRNKIMEVIGVDRDELSEMIISIKTKFKYKNRDGAEIFLTDNDKKYGNQDYTSNELRLLGQIDKLDKDNDHYPVYMTHYQIMQAIKEAYETARKTSGRRMHTEPDKRNPEDGDILVNKGVVEYEGYSSTFDLTIRFMYNFDLNYIDTAFPVREKNVKKYKPDLYHGGKKL